MPLSESIAVLANTVPPGAKQKKLALSAVNAQIIMLESRLGISPRLMPIFNPAKAIARLTELESQIAAKGNGPTAAALAPIAAAPAAAARPVELTDDATLDKAIAASGCHNLRHYSAKAKRDKLFATAANLPPGSLARQCAESNLAKAQTELNDCN